MTEVPVRIEAVQVPTPAVRDNSDDLARRLADLGKSIRDEGLQHPITLWGGNVPGSYGTLISGARRLRAYFVMAGAPDGRKFRHIPAVFVDTIEDAAKRLLADNQDERNYFPMKWVEVCRLWELMRKLDAPAALIRADVARRRGVELRRATLAGKRRPGKFSYSEDYVLHVLAEPFGISESTATRLWAIYVMSTDPACALELRTAARRALEDIDAGNSSIYTNYTRLKSGRTTLPARRKTTGPIPPAPAARQLAAWERSLPQMEGLVAGLAELGPPHPDLTRKQVGPTQDRLAAVRRDLDKMIKTMKEIAT